MISKCEMGLLKNDYNDYNDDPNLIVKDNKDCQDKKEIFSFVQQNVSDSCDSYCKDDNTATLMNAINEKDQIISSRTLIKDHISYHLDKDKIVVPHIKVMLYRNPILEKLLNKKTNASLLNEEIQRSKNSHAEVENKTSLEELQPDVIENFESLLIQSQKNRLYTSLNSSKDMESHKDTMASSRNVDLDIHNSSVGELELLLFESSTIKLKNEDYREFLLDNDNTLSKNEDYKEFLLDNDDTLSKFDNDLEELEITVDDIPTSIEITRELEEPLFEGFENVSTEKLKLKKFKNAAMKFVAETPSSDNICKSLIQTLSRISDHLLSVNHISEKKDHLISASHIGNAKDHSMAADFNSDVPLNANKDLDSGDEICVKGDAGQSCLIEKGNSVSSYDGLSTATHENYNLRRKSRSTIKKEHIKTEDKENVNINGKQKKRFLSEDSSQSVERKIKIRNQENEEDVFSKLRRMSDKDDYKNKIYSLRKRRRKSRFNSLNNESCDRSSRRSLRKRFKVMNSESSMQDKKGFNLCRRSLRNRFKNAEFKSSIDGQDSKEEPQQFTANSLGNEISNKNGGQDYSAEEIGSLQSNHLPVERILKRKIESLSAESSSKSIRNDSVAEDGQSRKKLKESNFSKKLQRRMNEEIGAKETKCLPVRVPRNTKSNYRTFMRTKSLKYRKFMKQNNIVVINYGLYSLKHIVSVEENEIINNYFFAKTSAEDLYKCYFCKYSSMDQQMVFKHLASHKINNVFWCVHCSFKAKYLSTLIKHSGAHAEDKLFSCNECIYKACSLYGIRNHKSVHTGFPPYNCNLCKFTCMSRTNMKSHIHEHKANRLKRLKNAIRILNCPCCSETFNGSRTYSNHIKTHFTHDIFRCPYCSFESWQFLDFREHILSHKEDRNKIFQCQHCNTKVESALNIIYHLKTHAGMLPCYACFKVFSKTIDLNEHKCVPQCDIKYSEQGRSTANIDTYKFYGKKSLSSRRESNTMGDNRFVNSEFHSTTSYATGRVCEERLRTLEGFKYKKKKSFEPSPFLKSEITERGLRIFNSQRVKPNKDQKMPNISLEETKLQTSDIAEVRNHLDSSKNVNFSVEDTQISSLKSVDDEGANKVNRSKQICGDTVMNMKENCQNISSNRESFTNKCSHFDKVEQNTGKEVLSESNEIKEFISKDIKANDMKKDGVTEQCNTNPCKTPTTENIDQILFNKDSSCKNENSTEIESITLKNGMMDSIKSSTCIDVNEEPQNDSVLEMAEQSKKLYLKDLSAEISNKEKSGEESLLNNETLIDLTKENVDDEILVLKREPCLKYFNKSHTRRKGHLISSNMCITNKEISDRYCAKNEQNSLGNVKVNHNGLCKVVTHSIENDEIKDLTNTKNISKCLKFKICRGKIVNSVQHKCDRVLTACHRSFNDLKHPCENGYILHNRIVQCGSNISHLTFKIFNEKIISYVIDHKKKSKCGADVKRVRYENTFSIKNDSTLNNSIVKNLESLHEVECKFKLENLRAVSESGELSDEQEGVAITFKHVKDQKFSKNCKRQNNFLKNSTYLKSKEKKFVAEFYLNIPEENQSSIKKVSSNNKDINKLFEKNSKVQNSLIYLKGQNKYLSENGSLKNFSGNKPLKVESSINLEQMKSLIAESTSEITKALDKGKLKTSSKKGKELKTIFIEDSISKKCNGQMENVLNESSPLNLNKNVIKYPSSKNFNEPGKWSLDFGKLNYKVPMESSSVHSTEIKSNVIDSSVNSKEKTFLKESSLENFKKQNSSLVESSVNSKEKTFLKESSLENFKKPNSSLTESSVNSKEKTFLKESSLENFKKQNSSLVESSVNSKEKTFLKESLLENFKDQNSSLAESSVNSKEKEFKLESPLGNSKDHKFLVKLKEQNMSILENSSLEQPSFVACENHENKIDTLCTGDSGVKENEFKKQNVESEVARRECFYECKYCNFGADKLFKLNIHLMEHSELNPFECSFCPLTFSKPKLLKAHMKTHAYEDQTSK